MSSTEFMAVAVDSTAAVDGTLMAVVTIAFIVIVLACVWRWSKGRAARRLLDRAKRRLATSKLGTFAGLSDGGDVRRGFEDLQELVHLALFEEVLIAIENECRPTGVLIVVLPEVQAGFVRQREPLALSVIRSAIARTVEEALVEANSRRHPGAGESHRADVRALLKESARAYDIDLQFMTGFGSRAEAVFASSLEYATAEAKRRFADVLPTNAQALPHPVALPDADRPAADHYLGTEWVEQRLRGEKQSKEPSRPATVATTRTPVTVSAVGGMGFGIADEAEPTVPVTPVVATLVDATGVHAAPMRMGQRLTVGRAITNDLVIAQDLSSSGHHIAVELLGHSQVRIYATGKTGTWAVGHEGVSRLLHTGSTSTFDLPVFLTLGDGKSTLLTIVEKSDEPRI